MTKGVFQNYHLRNEIQKIFGNIFPAFFETCRLVHTKCNLHHPKFDLDLTREAKYNRELNGLGVFTSLNFSTFLALI